MKQDHPPLMKEETPKHHHNVHHVEKHYGGDGHKHHHHIYKEHAADHKLHHEHVEALCGGGMTRK